MRVRVWLRVRVRGGVRVGRRVWVRVRVRVSVFGYKVVVRWKKNNVGKEYFDYLASEDK